MTTTLDALDRPRPATLDDHREITNLIKEAAGWLRTKGTDQWAEPWPSPEERDERIRASLAAGSTWIVWDGANAVATVTAHRDGHERLWTPEERRQPAVYVHRLVVSRAFAGREIGARLLDWTARRAAAEYGACHTRIDVWTTNTALHAYYRQIGFTFVRYVDGWPAYPSGALFQRPIDAQG